MSHDSLLRTLLTGIALNSPVILAAGTHGTLDEFGDVCDLSRIGGLVAKSVTPLERLGNKTYRILDLPGGAGMLNAVGLANPGIEAFERDYLPRAASLPCAVIASVAGFSIDDYVVLASRLNAWGRDDRTREGGRGPVAGIRVDPVPSIDAIELNVSCPNVKAGCDFVSSPEMLTELLIEVRKVITRCKLIVKLSPFPREMLSIARAAIDAGADALTISNTIPAMSIDVHTRAPRLANVMGGMSGPGLHAVAVRLVHEVYSKLAKDAHGVGKGVPIIGAGGVMRWEDAAEFIIAGASCVQMGTALLADPRSPLRVNKGLARWVRVQGCTNIAELVGSLRLG